LVTARTPGICAASDQPEGCAARKASWKRLYPGRGRNRSAFDDMQCPARHLGPAASIGVHIRAGARHGYSSRIPKRVFNRANVSDARVCRARAGGRLTRQWLQGHLGVAANHAAAHRLSASTRRDRPVTAESGHRQLCQHRRPSGLPSDPRRRLTERFHRRGFQASGVCRYISISPLRRSLTTFAAVAPLPSLVRSEFRSPGWY